MRRSGRLVAFSATIGLVGFTTVASVAASDEPVSLGAAEVVFTSDFEDGTTQGWFGRGPAEVVVATDEAHSGEASLMTTGRADTWQGPGRDMRDELQAGTTYEIEAFVRLSDGDAPVHLSVQRTPAGDDTAFERVVSGAPASAGEWTLLRGAYTFDSSDNVELQLYVESDDPTVDIYLDDVLITTIADPGETLVETDFEDGTTQSWGPRGPAEVAASQADAATGEWSLLTTGRTEPWNGPSLTITPYVEPGVTYHVEAHLKLVSGEPDAVLRMSIQADRDGESTFENITPNLTVTDQEWVPVTAQWTPASAADAFHLYAESSEALVDFHLDDFVLSAASAPEIEDIAPLFEVLADHFPIGAAIDQRETAGPSAELLTRHFNSITAENHMKPESIQPTEGQFAFGQADQLVEFAESNGLRIYGHTLVWHSQTPDWFFQDENGDPLTSSPEHRQLALDRMQAHIQAIAEHYGDRIWAWDVVNEAIDESQADGLRRSPWYTIIGPDYLNHAFEFARDAFGPDVLLFLNDYNTEFPAKREAMFGVVEQLVADGAPIDGVGHQLHLNLVRPISWVDQSIERFRELPVVQAVTELDVSISTSSQESLPVAPPDRVVRQGYYFRDLFDVLRGHGDVLVSVTAWGLHDGRSWLRTWPIDRPHEAPLFFSDSLQAKPAYWGVVDPDELAHLSQAINVSGGTPEVDGERDLVWDLRPETVLQAGDEGQPGTGFQLRWDAEHLYVLVEVADPAAAPDDRVELYVDDTNAKAGDYTEGDVHYGVHRDGTVDGPATAAVTETASGYRVEVALPLATLGEPGRVVGFDIRVTDGGTGEQVSWSDQNHEQDSDTSRWGTATFIEPQSHVDIPRAASEPQIDGEIDPVWADAAEVTTEVLVEGSAEGAQAVVRLLWDENQLYVLAEVDDPHLNADNSDAWEQDSIEIFVDPDNTKSGAFKESDGQYRISYQNHQTLNGVLGVIGENLTSAALVVDGGYVIEASVELTGMEAGAGSFIGLDLQVNDATDGRRTAVHTWHDPTGQSFQNTTRWGVGRLVDEPDGPATCDHTVTGRHTGPLTVTEGVTCLAPDSRVTGPVTVAAGGGLRADGATVTGPLTTTGATVVELVGSRLTGRVSIAATSTQVVVAGNRITGPVMLTGNSTGETPIIVSGNTITGALSCSGNQPTPVNDGEPNSVVGPRQGQCVGM